MTTGNLKEIEDKIRKANPKKIISKKTVPTSRVSIITSLNNKTLNECVEILKNEFERASKKLNINNKDLVLVKASTGYSTWIDYKRLETDEEYEERIQELVAQKLREIKYQNNRAAQKKSEKKKQLKKLLSQFSEEEVLSLLTNK